jgi:hypothetical protein
VCVCECESVCVSERESVCVRVNLCVRETECESVCGCECVCVFVYVCGNVSQNCESEYMSENVIWYVRECESGCVCALYRALFFFIFKSTN